MHNFCYLSPPKGALTQVHPYPLDFSSLLHIIRQVYVWGKEVKRSTDRLIKRPIKVGAGVSCQVRPWCLPIASAFPLLRHYQALLAWGTQASQQ